MPRLSEQEKERLAELVADGVPFWRICEVIGRVRWTTRRNINYLKRPPKPEPERSPLRLSLAEREEISRGLAGRESLQSIARRLGRAPSTISREVRSNGGARRHRACGADKAALGRTRRPQPAKLARCEQLRRVVEAKLELRWSPQQISGWLVGAFPDQPEMRVSHETIYLSLFVQARGTLRKELTRYLRRGHANRRPLGHSIMNGQGQLRGTIHISQRPAEANDRAVPGHWEGDLIFGKHMSAVATLVERKSRFVMLIGLPDGHTADVVTDALAAKIVELPTQLRRSITWDHGKEMAQHARFSIATGVPVYFCDPPSPWQRGSNENTNGFYASTSPSAATCAPTPRPTSTPSLPSSTTALDKPSDGSHHHKHSTKRCDDPLRPQAVRWHVPGRVAVRAGTPLGAPPPEQFADYGASRQQAVDRAAE